MTHSKLEEGDLESIEVLKVHSPSFSLSEIIQELPALEIYMSAISRAIKNRLPSGEQYTRKNSLDWQERDLLRKTCSIPSFSSITFRHKIRID
jgi:hypothetical protein